MEFENNIIKLIANNNSIEKWIKDYIDERATHIASLFGINDFPEDFKICIHFLKSADFIKLAEKYGFLSKIANCYAISIDAIYIIEYTDISKKESKENYCKIILHEYIHILQHISTSLLPSKAVWLYESIACYLSGQETPPPTSIPSWSLFESDFYSINDCYSIVYIFGKLFLDTVGIDTLIEYKDKLIEINNIGKMIYSRLQEELY